MIELERPLIEAILKLKRECGPYLVVVHRGDWIHSLVTGDSTVLLWLVPEVEPLTEDTEVSSLSLTDVRNAASILRSVNRCSSLPIRLALTPNNDLSLTVFDTPGEFLIRADSDTFRPTLAGLKGVLKKVQKASRGNFAGFHPAYIHRLYQAMKGVCGRVGLPRILPNGNDLGLVLLDSEPRLFGALAPMMDRDYPESIIDNLL